MSAVFPLPRYSLRLSFLSCKISITVATIKDVGGFNAILVSASTAPSCREYSYYYHFQCTQLAQLSNVFLHVHCKSKTRYQLSSTKNICFLQEPQQKKNKQNKTKSNNNKTPSLFTKQSLTSAAAAHNLIILSWAWVTFSHTEETS